MSGRPAAGDQRAPVVAVFALSLATILLEIAYTRIFSFKLHYYFTYLILGIAMLGLGTGGVLVTVAARLRAGRPGLVPTCCLVASATVLGGYFVIATVAVSAFQFMTASAAAKLVLLMAAIFPPFLCVGIVLATIFATHARDITRLYGVDLLGAALGCAVCVPLLALLTPPGCVMLSALLLALAGIAASSGGLRRIALGLAALATVALAFHRALPDPIPDPAKSLGEVGEPYGPTVFSAWSPVFRIDVTHKDAGLGVEYWVHHDAHLGTTLHAFNGDMATVAPHFRTDARALPFAVLAPKPTVLIIGAAGGHEILASLFFDAAHVTGVELNPVTVSLLREHFADYTGRIAYDPRVTLVNDEGRSFLQQHDERYDLIWFVAPDSYAAMNAAGAAAFVLSESYLYTVEMITESLRHLTPDGILCAQFGEVDFPTEPNRTARYLASVRAALAVRGVTDVAAHVLVATRPGPPMWTPSILVKTTPFTEAERARFVASSATLPESRVVHAGAVTDTGPIGHVLGDDPVTLERWFAAHPYDLRPVPDDAPFFWHFVRFRDALGSATARGLEVTHEQFIGERVLLLLLVVAASFAACWLVLPFVGRFPQWRAAPFKLATSTYFAALGLGFMAYEVTLIQMLTLLLGYPTYSLSVTLFALLLFAGLGSLATGAASGRVRPTLAVLITSLAGLTAFYQLGLPAVVAASGGAGLPARIALAVIVIAPLGLCLGAFMPLGIRTLAAAAPQQPALVAWGWAVNGFFSVLGSMASTLVAMSYGFRTLLLIAFVAYLIAMLSLVRIRAESAPD